MTQHKFLFMFITHLSWVHADRHLTVQIALTDHVRASGMDQAWRLQRLNKAPSQCFIPIPSNHLLQHRASSWPSWRTLVTNGLKVWFGNSLVLNFHEHEMQFFDIMNHFHLHVMNNTIITFTQWGLNTTKAVYIQGNTFPWPKNEVSLCWTWKSGEIKHDFVFNSYS